MARNWIKRKRGLFYYRSNTDALSREHEQAKINSIKDAYFANEKRIGFKYSSSRRNLKHDDNPAITLFFDSSHYQMSEKFHGHLPFAIEI